MNVRRLVVRQLLALCFILLTAVAGCSRFDTSGALVDVPVLEGPAPRANTTPVADALACLRKYEPSINKERLAVSDFIDGTGAVDSNTTNSKAFTQRPDLMLITALSAAGVHLVNRNSIAVAEWEMKNAIERKLGDGHMSVIDNQKIAFRPVKPGIFLGSTHYISGAITELNYNIDSATVEAGAYSIQAGKRVYRISIAIDVMVTNTETTQIVMAKSYKKQLVGYQTTAGFFRFVSTSPLMSMAQLTTAGMPNLEAFDANLDEKKNEPTQQAVRWLINTAAYDIVRSLTNKGGECDKLLPPASRDDLEATLNREKPDREQANPGPVAASEKPEARPQKSARIDQPAAAAVIAERAPAKVVMQSPPLTIPSSPSPASAGERPAAQPRAVASKQPLEHQTAAVVGAAMTTRAEARVFEGSHPPGQKPSPEAEDTRDRLLRRVAQATRPAARSGPIQRKPERWIAGSAPALGSDNFQ